MNVLVQYEYRDAGNNKRHGSWTVTGVPDEAALTASLTSDGFFVPDAVGMPMLSPSASEWDDDLDHPFHSIVSVSQTPEPADEDRGFDALVAAFRRADWEEAGVDHEMAMCA